MDLIFLYHKYSYWVKILLAGIICISTILMKMYSAILIIKIWECSSILFITFLLLGSVDGLRPYWAYFTLTKSEPLTLDDNLLTLAQSMGSSISTFFPAKDFDSVFVFCGSDLVIGENTRKKLSDEELEAALAHEFSHDIRKRKHDRLHILSVILILAIIILLAFAHVSIYRIYLVMFALFYIFESQISWIIECDCDENAVEYVPTDELISAISKIYEGRLNSYSFKHPSPNYRFKRLKSRANDLT
jgi:hypothetical protein